MAWRRDQTQREALIAAQLDERQRLQERILEVRRTYARERDQLEQDIAAYMLRHKTERDMTMERVNEVNTQGREGGRRARDEPGLDIGS